MFLLGVSIGLLIASIIVMVMIYFRTLIESKFIVIEKRIESAGPKPKGFVIEPETEAEEFRRETIENNDRAGFDTPIESLR